MGIFVKNLTKSFKLKVNETQGGIHCWLKSIFMPKYNEICALNDISLSINDGDIVGLIGPNGAGKSTLVKILSGILKHDTGVCEIDGIVPWDNRLDYVKRIGVMFGQKSQLIWDIAPIDSFILLKEIYRLDTSDFNKTISELIEIFSLSQIINTPVRLLSLGQRIKCELVASLLHKPKYLFLDEPTIGLDVETKISLRDYIKTINQSAGVTIVITTHDMLDVESMCNNVIVIDHGKILYDGKLDDFLRKQENSKELIIYFSAAHKELENVLRQKYHLLEYSGNRTRIKLHSDWDNVYEIISFISSHCSVIDFDIQHLPIDELMACYYKKNTKKRK